ncbi:MAG: hypothetical protein AB7P21_30700 [Lautropia sp.]
MPEVSNLSAPRRAGRVARALLMASSLLLGACGTLSRPAAEPEPIVETAPGAGHAPADASRAVDSASDRNKLPSGPIDVLINEVVAADPPCWHANAAG